MDCNKRRKYTSILSYFTLALVPSLGPLTSENLLLGKELILSNYIVVKLNSNNILLLLVESQHFPWSRILTMLEKIGVEIHFGGQKNCAGFPENSRCEQPPSSMWELAFVWMLGRGISPQEDPLSMKSACAPLRPLSFYFFFSDCITSFTGCFLQKSRSIKIKWCDA